MKRLFLALRVRLYDYDSLKFDFSNIIEGKWTRDENLHVTICYFGDLYTKEEILDKMPLHVREIEPLSLSSIGFFSHNNILYAKPQGYSTDILHSSVCSLFVTKEKKAFIPHATLMRIKKINDTKTFKDKMDKYENKEIGIIEPTLRLMQSRPQSGGVKYVCLKEFK